MKRLVPFFVLFFLIGTMPVHLSAQEADTTQLVEEVDQAAKPVQAKPESQQKFFYGGNLGI